MTEALSLLDQCQDEFGQKFKRHYRAIMRCHEGDQNSETAIICCGAMTGTARVAVASLNENGTPVDLFKLRLLRPFPTTELTAALKDKKRVIVLNRACSYGAGGTLSQEIRAALYNLPERPIINDVMISLGGKEVFPETISKIFNDREELSETECNWL